MKLKRIILTVLSLMMSLILAACGSNQSEAQEAENVEPGVYPLDTTEDLETAIENDEIIYASKTDCPHCQAFKPKLQEAAEEAEVAIYEYDLQEQEEKQNPDLNSHIDLLKVILVPAIRPSVEGEIQLTQLTGESSVEEIQEVLENYQ